MNCMLKTHILALRLLTTFGLLSLSMIVLSGCGKSETATTGSEASPAVSTVDHSHGGWWCPEHGVPEEECAQCDKSLVAKFKAAGDCYLEQRNQKTREVHQQLEAMQKAGRNGTVLNTGHTPMP